MSEFKWDDKTKIAFADFAISEHPNTTLCWTIDAFKKQKLNTIYNDKRDWEIIEFKHNYCYYKLVGNKYYRDFNGCEVSLTCMPSNAEIKSVRRISDGEVFSVGDKVVCRAFTKPHTINSFVIFNLLNYIEMRVIGNEPEEFNFPFLEIQKPKQPIKPYVVFTKPTHGSEMFKPYNFGNQNPTTEHYERFETKEAANVYCRLHWGCLNLLEVHEALYAGYEASVTDSYEKLNKLVEEKLNRL